MEACSLLVNLRKGMQSSSFKLIDALALYWNGTTINKEDNKWIKRNRPVVGESVQLTESADSYQWYHISTRLKYQQLNVQNVLRSRSNLVKKKNKQKNKKQKHEKKQQQQHNPMS